ncbi:MAG: hypothetical protein GY874_14010 [Desulfobacteraceae bacterium]|nr:hypothetical protein [Desulfobacteraceae bacterium]
MKTEDKQLIHQWSGSHKAPDSIFFAPGSGGQKSDSLFSFCEHLGGEISGLHIEKQTDDPFEAPAIIIGRHQNIAFQASPTGKVLQFFLDGLSQSTGNPPRPAASIENHLKKIDLPIQFALYIAGHCPHCPLVVRQLLPVAAMNENIRLSIIDAELFIKKAASNDVSSVPTLIFDGQLRWTGQINIQEVLQVSIQRDPCLMSAMSLRRTIEAGQADRLASMMIQRDALFPALIELLTHLRWSVRLGAMVTVEYLIDGAPQLSQQLADMLWQRFDRLDSQVQGDVAHILGLIRSQQAKTYLNKIIAGTYTEQVKEAAREALEQT